MKNTFIPVLIIILISILGCFKNKNNRLDTAIESKPLVQVIDTSKIKLIVERGAFHFDKFILQDTTITFYPSAESVGKEHESYNQVSTKKITKKQRNRFIKKILDDGFFKLNDTYSNGSSCNSVLTVTFSFDHKNKKVTSDDFTRGCPELLQYIEKEIIRLHNRNLKRIFLPG